MKPNHVEEEEEEEEEEDQSVRQSAGQDLLKTCLRYLTSQIEGGRSSPSC